MIKPKIYIILFSILYMGIAVVSTVHAVSFFNLANNLFMGITLAGMFEIGQAAVLFSLLSSKRDRSKMMPWILMTILTLVQVMGNVFSSYKYLMLNSTDSIRFFTEPILFFLEPNDPLVNVILTYIVGAILPIVALCMTSMLVHHLEDNTEITSNNSVETKYNDKSIREENLETKIDTEQDLINEIEDIPKIETHNESNKGISSDNLLKEAIIH